MEYISSRGLFVVKIILLGVLVLVLKDLDVKQRRYRGYGVKQEEQGQVCK